MPDILLGTVVGPHFTPSVDNNGNLSWTNDGGLPNPASVNIRGPKGDTGTFSPEDRQRITDLESGKVDKVTGKGLSTNDYTTAEKDKLSGIEAQANKTIIDATLSNAGQAADAKTTGDNFAVLRGILSRMEIYCEASGNPATFSDAKAANIKALSVTITPTQSGSGDPSPTNVRPISGFSSVSVTRTGQNGANPQTVTVTLTDGTSPLTVYGGTLDVTAGKLIVTHQKITLPPNLTDNSRYFGGVSFDNILGYSGLRLPGICTHTAVETRYPSTSGRSEYMWLGVNNRHIYWVDIMNALGMSSIAEFNAWLTAQTPEVVFPLAAPLTYQLTPQQLSTLAGYNAVSSDAGAVEVTYKADASTIFGGG